MLVSKEIEEIPNEPIMWLAAYTELFYSWDNSAEKEKKKWRRLYDKVYLFINGKIETKDAYKTYKKQQKI